MRSPESGIRNPESGKFSLVESGIQQIFASESGILENFWIRNPGNFAWGIFASEFRILGFGIWNTAQGIGNPTNDSNPESVSSIDKVFGRNPVPGIRNPWPGIQNPRLSPIPIHGLVKGSSVFLQHFQLLFLHHKKSVLFIIHMTISTLLILAVRRTHVIHEPCIRPSSPFVA